MSEAAERHAATLGQRVRGTHAAQIVRQIQSYMARDTTSRIDLALQAR